jgi:hypothetical protein
LFGPTNVCLVISNALDQSSHDAYSTFLLHTDFISKVDGGCISVESLKCSLGTVRKNQEELLIDVPQG